MNNNTALIIAVIKGHLNIVEILLKNGADVNYKNKYDNTVLMCAAEKGYLDIVKSLILAGADIHKRNKFDNTALIIAVIKGHLNIVEILLKNGANVNNKNIFGDTILMIAIKNNHLEIVKILISAGADINLANKYGDSGLSLTAKNEDIKKILEVALKVKNLLKELKNKFIKDINTTIDDVFSWQDLVKALLKNGDEVIANTKIYYLSWFKQGFINSLKINKEKHSLLHFVVLKYSNDSYKTDENKKLALHSTLDIIKNLITNWLINLDYKDNTLLTAWNHSCQLEQIEIAAAIKNNNQLTVEDKEFLEKNFALKKDKEGILKYYSVLKQDVVSSINDDKNLPIETINNEQASNNLFFGFKP